MTNTELYKDIAARTGGDIYIGIVGPVRTGKSTFIKRFMDTLVLPNISEDYIRERANDELPQSAAGRTIMTTEPKFIPETAVEMTLDGKLKMSVRLVDCVGYIVPSALGYIEDEKPRMVKTPWFDKEIPFNMAAEIGTKKVTTEHSTVGIVITTDGTIGEIERSEYEEAEGRVIEELKELNKPFVVLLNSTRPTADETKDLADELSKKYEVRVIPVDCLGLSENDIKNILTEMLYEFPVRDINFFMPSWINSLEPEHWLKLSIFDSVRNLGKSVRRIREAAAAAKELEQNENITSAVLKSARLGSGSVDIEISCAENLFYKILTEQSGFEISDERELMSTLSGLAQTEKKYRRVKNALDEVEATGYGIVMPDVEEMVLAEPEIMKQGGQYGVRLKASAPSIHMMKAEIKTELAPVVGSEKQSEDLVKYLLAGFEDDPLKIWDSNIFGKSLHDLVNEGLHAKLAKMPPDARGKVRETIERVINEGCNGLICIIL